MNALAELEALGIAFVSLRDNLDLTTLAGRLMFQIIGAMAEFEPALIQERVKAGLRNARAKGKRLGRPRVFVNESRIATLRASGASCGRSRRNSESAWPRYTESPAIVPTVPNTRNRSAGSH